MVAKPELDKWMLDVMRWAKYVQLFPEDSYINNEAIVVMYGAKSLGVSPFSLWKPYYDEGRSPEEAVEMFIAHGK